MRLAWVELRDFRNHAQTRIDPVPDGLLVAVGPNGEGKTNLLEGMHFLYALGSPADVARTSRSCGRAPTPRTSRGEFETRDGRVLVEIEIPTQGANRVQVNRSPVRRKRDLRRQVRAVLFGPFDLPIVIGDPSKRRAFLDEAVDRALAAQGLADHGLRPGAAPAEPAAEGVGPAGRPRRGSRRGTRS